MKPSILEAYRNYDPPRWIRPTVERLLAGIPPNYVSGLGAIVLTDRAAIGGGKTRRVAGRKYNRDRCLGFYHQKYGGTTASIEIVVDNAIAGWPAPVLVLGLCRDLVLARVLFHELGHHLDVTIGAAAPTGEVAAEDWHRRLSRLYFRGRYWWLRHFVRILGPVARWLRGRPTRGRSQT